MPTIPFYQPIPRFGCIHRVLISAFILFMRIGFHFSPRICFLFSFELLYLSLSHSSVSFSIFPFSVVRSSFSALQVFSLTDIFFLDSNCSFCFLRLLSISVFVFSLMILASFFLLSLFPSFYRFRFFLRSFDHFPFSSFLSLSLFPQLFTNFFFCLFLIEFFCFLLFFFRWVPDVLMVSVVFFLFFLLMNFDFSSFSR